MRQVVVQQQGQGDVVVLSTWPGVIGDELTLDLAGSPDLSTIRVTVAASKPVAVEGGVFYELRLRPVGSL
jgi:hypothetical protein